MSIGRETEAVGDRTEALGVGKHCLMECPDREGSWLAGRAGETFAGLNGRSPDGAQEVFVATRADGAVRGLGGPMTAAAGAWKVPRPKKTGRNLRGASSPRPSPPSDGGEGARRAGEEAYSLRAAQTISRTRRRPSSPPRLPS